MRFTVLLKCNMIVCCVCLMVDARIPAGVANLQQTSSDWADFAEPLPGQACTALINQRSFWPRGKCLGTSDEYSLKPSLRYL